MKRYEAPVCEIELFETLDIMASSTEGPTDPTQATNAKNDPYAVDKF